ncbi:hypothetical protein [Snodgrassella sp. CFCC 13594]|uniref:hypothetical protein n=1 Tax=Snodgrassella sp. CFCC 13594 TaxID=1775559 RepID=UPI0008303519|nr:hypothetical protein [Snodgrassella sp. CFCC 13594]
MIFSERNWLYWLGRYALGVGVVVLANLVGYQSVHHYYEGSGMAHGLVTGMIYGLTFMFSMFFLFTKAIVHLPSRVELTDETLRYVDSTQSVHLPWSQIQSATMKRGYLDVMGNTATIVIDTNVAVFTLRCLKYPDKCIKAISAHLVRIA